MRDDIRQVSLNPGARDHSTIEHLVGEVWRRRWLMLALFVLPLIASLGYLHLAPSRWEAVVLLQPGQIGQLLGGTRMVEPTARIVERVRSRPFRDSVAAALDSSADPSLLRATLKSRPLGGDLVELRVQGYSADQAREHANAALRQLTRAHEQLAQPAVDSVREQIATVTKEFEALVRDQAELNRIYFEASRRISEPVQVAAVVALAGARSELLKFKGTLEDALKAQTSPTIAIGGVWAPDAATMPQTGTVLAAGLIAGILLVVVAAIAAYLARLVRAKVPA